MTEHDLNRMLCFWNARVAERNYQMLEQYRDMSLKGYLSGMDIFSLRKIKDNLRHATEQRNRFLVKNGTESV